MFNLAAILLIIAIVAGVLGLGTVAGMPMHVAWILCVVGIALALAFVLLGRRPDV
jgi:uncharacterized membrane protein YtjA (UPF0391 family)